MDLDQSNVFGTVVLLTAICGVIIVAGGIFLLANGAITLASTSPADAMTLEWQKKFKFHTQVPGIAFFAIGLMFVIIALFSSKPPKDSPIDVDGLVDGVDGPVTIVARAQPTQNFSYLTGGAIQGTVYPESRMLILEASAPGYEPRLMPIKVAPATHISIGKVQLRRVLKEELPAREQNIIRLNFTAPPVTDTALAYGAPR